MTSPQNGEAAEVVEAPGANELQISESGAGAIQRKFCVTGAEGEPAALSSLDALSQQPEPDHAVPAIRE